MINWGGGGSLLLLLFFTLPDVSVLDNFFTSEVLDIYSQLPRPGYDEPTSCNRYDQDPAECRWRGCYYQCEINKCDPPSAVACPKKKDQGRTEVCGRNCYDVCGCRRIAKCEFNVAGGNCITMYPESGMECRRRMFNGWECLQKDKFYIEAGVPCKMKKSSAGLGGPGGGEAEPTTEAEERETP